MKERERGESLEARLLAAHRSLRWYHNAPPPLAKHLPIAAGMSSSVNITTRTTESERERERKRGGVFPAPFSAFWEVGASVGSMRRFLVDGY